MMGYYLKSRSGPIFFGRVQSCEVCGSLGGEDWEVEVFWVVLWLDTKFSENYAVSVFRVKMEAALSSSGL
jgi:hypothetical protein